MDTMDASAMPPIELGEPDWAIVHSLLSTHLAGWKVWAFGSRARKTAKPYSDLDLAVLADHALTLEELARINDAFDSSDLTIKVDVVDLRSVSEAFRALIERDKVLLQ
jgi:type I restriction enzyme S subunit